MFDSAIQTFHSYNVDKLQYFVSCGQIWRQKCGVDISMATKQTILYYTCSAYHSALTRTYVVKQLQNYVSATLLLSTNVSMTQFRKDFFMEQKNAQRGYRTTIMFKDFIGMQWTWKVNTISIMCPVLTQILKYFTCPECDFHHENCFRNWRGILFNINMIDSISKLSFTVMHIFWISILAATELICIIWVQCTNCWNVMK